ncbi:MAG: hypothetical protein BroJett003_07730 [Planctomycetota bacterium]|nr:MAG: hypothetical protein BroJett003_07730 [Planctomycetota bacterium]
MNPVEFIIRCHEQTKHYFHRYARSAGELDWSNQPDPFRAYAGAPRVMLPLATVDPSPAYESLFSLESLPVAPVTLETISVFLECALGLSAWKSFKGSRWALRCNPSSGNLHPTEGYVVLGATSGLHDQPAVYHYAPAEHALERRGELSEDGWRALIEGLPVGAFLVGLTSIAWREAWKYGERALRYCQHDVGHAIGALRFSAASLGWSLHVLEAMSDEDVETLLGLDAVSWPSNSDREHADLLAVVNPSGQCIVDCAGKCVLDCHALKPDRATWTGTPNVLSRESLHWELVYAAAEAWRKPRGAPAPLGSQVPPTVREHARDDAYAAASASRPVRSSREIIRMRRSAVAFDGVATLPAEQFFLMMHRLMPDPQRAPWDALSPPTAIHLAIFVHRVTGLTPGLYALVRDPSDRESLASSMRPDFAWTAPPGCPDGLPLFFLLEGDARRAATAVSCHQFIAGAGVFSLGMIARFRDTLEHLGAWGYRRLFWEAGLVGQTLYLEAEAAGLRGTGIGCYFDDAVHETFGLTGDAWQSMYHFTVGRPVEDVRLTTEPAYPRRRADLP